VKFSTTRFGELEIEDNKILVLPGGLIGIPDCKKVVLFDHQPQSPFRWLQSAEIPELAFVVIDPLDLAPDYPIERLKDILANDRKVARPKEIAVAAITTVPSPPAPITVNLTAPLVFDLETRNGAQIILHDARFKTRQILIQVEKSSAETA
jgi:flagellar assembly factor FliW